jgi:hypothetical protein
MFRTMIVAFVALALLAAPAPAQVKDKVTEKALPPLGDKGTPKTAPAVKAPVEVFQPGEVEIHLLNGSTVRMILQSEKLEIATAYGRLAVPATDILAIDFGLHFPDGMDSRIQQAVKSLGGENFRDRDQAGKTLLELGPYSFPAVAEASRSGDLETSRRAKDLLKQLQKKHPKKDLKTSADDRVITPNFTISGRILTATIKAKAELFGEVDMPVARMRSLRSLAGTGFEIEVSIDATRYANQGQWMETEFNVDGRSTIVITAKGTVDTWPQQGGQYQVGPNGLQGRGMGNIVAMVPGRKIGGPINGQMYGGALIGRIGEDGEPFTIGERYEGTPEAQGKLYLHIGPSPWNAQSQGSFDVKIARKN